MSDLRRWLPAAACFVAAAAALAIPSLDCRLREPRPDPLHAPTGTAARTIRVGDVPLEVEVADTHALRAQGLMHRKQLPAEAGMLFVFGDLNRRSFWMKNTLVPLSIAYLAPDGTVLEIHDMTPLDTTPVPSRQPAAFALEVNHGWFARHGLGAGATVSGISGLHSKD